MTSPAPARSSGVAEPPLRDRWLPPLAAAFVLLGLLASTFLVWRWVDAAEEQALERDFDYRGRDVAHRVEQRMQDQLHVLRGAAALFAASREVEREEFRSYVTRLQLDEHHLGLTGLGFAVVVAPEELDAHTAAVRAEGFPDYALRPPGARETYTSVVYLEPFTGRNLRAFGYDMFSEPVRREAMERARDEGREALSGKVTLVQESDVELQAGTLLLLPVFRGALAPQTVAERRERLIGWVYMPLRMGDLFNGAFGERGPDLDAKLYDGAATVPAALLYDSEPKHGPRVGARRFEATRSIEVAGRVWTLVVSSTPSGRLTAPLVAGGGLALSLLLTTVVWLLASGRARALRAARGMNHELLGTLAHLEASERRFRTMADGAPVLIWVAGIDKHCTWFNRPWLHFTGRTMEQEQGDGWAEGVHPDDLARCFATYVEHFDRRVPFAMDYRLRRHDGEYRWLEDRGHPLLDDAGGFAGYIGSCFDITERRDALAAVKVGEQRLQEQTTRLTLVLEGAEQGSWDWDVPSGRVEYSERWASMLGYRLDELEPSLATWQRLVHPEDRPSVEAALGAHLQGRTEQYESEHRLQHRDGTWRWILDRGRVVARDAAAAPLRVAGTHTDVTERRRAEEQRAELLGREQRAARATAIGTLAAGLAHEINNPLTVVLSGLGFFREQFDALPQGPLPLAPSGGSSVAELHEVLTEAVEAARRVRGIVADLRSLATVDPRANSCSDLRSVVARAERVAHHAIPEGTELTLELAAAPVVRGSEAELVQLFACLLVNAGQAHARTPHQIRVTALRRGATVEVQVGDNGCGIPPEHLSQLFDPFFTTRSVGQGRGLGLPVALGIARAVGGDLSVESELERGTIVTVTLLLAPTA